jgi:hypothetical protein
MFDNGLLGSFLLRRRRWLILRRHEARVKSKNPFILSAAAVAGVLMALVAGIDFRSARDDARAQVVKRELQPIATLLRENQGLLRALELDRIIEKESSILESYLIKIRSDGVVKHADIKEKLDQLAENNTAVVTLIKAYAAHAKTPTFDTEADKFRTYASAWRDRWNSVMEVFMAGGDYPAAEIPFPTDFPAATNAEIAAMR